MSRTTFCRLICTLLVATLLVLPTVLMALEVPSLSARVNDSAGMLSPSTISQLEGSLKTFENDESTQIVVLTIPSLEGEVLEKFSIRVAEQWRIGQKGLDNGAILLIVRDERKLRIEVGYGLEGSLTDLTSGRIIRNVIVPRFKQGNFDQGIIDGVAAIMATVRGEFTATDPQPSGQIPPDTEGFLVALVAAIFFIGKLFSRNRILAASAGGIFAPILGFMLLGAKWLFIAALIPVGIVGGLIASVLSATSMASGKGGRSSRSISRHGGFGGSSGGFGGGFSGGGGSFGGGGASGGW